MSSTKRARAAELEQLATSDPDDEADRRAHGFDMHATDYDEPCRNGCGLTYGDIVAGKIRRCDAPQHEATLVVQRYEDALWADRATLLRYFC